MKRINIYLALVTVLGVELCLGEGLSRSIRVALRRFGVEGSAVNIILQLLVALDLALLLAGQELGFLEVGVRLRGIC